MKTTQSNHIVVEIEDMVYEIISDRDMMDIDAIHAYLSRSYWSENIPKKIVQKAVENSLCFGVFHDGSQVGFGRLVTDLATFAYLADVYILEEHRGKGLSKKLIQHIIEYPELQGLRRILLATRDAHVLYAQFGFVPPSHPELYMELSHQYADKPPSHQP